MGKRFSLARLYTCSYQSRDIIHSWQIPLSFSVKVKNGLRLFDLLTCWWCAFHWLLFIVNSLNLKWDQRKAHRKEEVPLGVLVKRRGTHDWGNLTRKSVLQGLTGLSADWFDTHMYFLRVWNPCVLKESQRVTKISISSVKNKFFTEWSSLPQQPSILINVNSPNTYFNHV